MSSGTSGRSQWLAARETHLTHPESLEGADDAFDLRQRHQLRVPEKGVAWSEDLRGHAIRTAEAATVGDRDPQIMQRPFGMRRWVAPWRSGLAPRRREMKLVFPRLKLSWNYKGGGRHCQ